MVNGLIRWHGALYQQSLCCQRSERPLGWTLGGICRGCAFIQGVLAHLGNVASCQRFVNGGRQKGKRLVWSEACCRGLTQTIDVRCRSEGRKGSVYRVPSHSGGNLRAFV